MTRKNFANVNEYGGMICQDDYELKVSVLRDIYTSKKKLRWRNFKFIQIFYRIFSNVKVKIEYVIMEYNFLRFRLFYFQALKLNSTQRKINKLEDNK